MIDEFNIRRVDGYTIISNYHLRDKKLSHAARDLLSFMLSLPDDLDYSFNFLVVIGKEGKAAIRTIINELKDLKYVKTGQTRDEKGYFQSNYEVYKPENVDEVMDKIITDNKERHVKCFPVRYKVLVDGTKYQLKMKKKSLILKLKKVCSNTDFFDFLEALF